MPERDEIMLKNFWCKIKWPTKYPQLFSVVHLWLPLPWYLSKAAFFHSDSPSEAVLVSRFGEVMHKDWKPDTGKGHGPLPAERGLWSPVCWNWTQLRSKEFRKPVALPNIYRYFPFQPQNSRVPTAGYALMPGPASVIQPIGCKIAPFPPSACTQQAEDCFCWGETWWKCFTRPSTTYNNVENRYLKVQRSV